MEKEQQDAQMVTGKGRGEERLPQGDDLDTGAVVSPLAHDPCCPHPLSCLGHTTQ